MATHKLNALFVARVSKPGKYLDGGGLALQVTAGKDGTPRKSWTGRYVSPETRQVRWPGYGRYPAVSLAEARARRDVDAAMVRAGLDPIEERAREAARAAIAAAKAMSFDTCVSAFLASNAPAWTVNHRETWKRSLAAHASPVFGALPVEAVDIGLVLKALEPIWHEKPTVAPLVCRRIEAVLRYAIARGWRSPPNPASWRDCLAHILPPTRKIHATTHHKALPYVEIPELMARLRAEESMAAKSLRFLILTAARVSEATGATWNEIEGDLWTIPGSRMKGRRPHRVALSKPAIEILKALRSVKCYHSEGAAGTLVFPSSRAGRSLAGISLARVLRQLGFDATVHGFRSSFCDWAFAETETAREIVEAALAHRVGDATEQAYRRGDALERRRRLMDAWAAYCTGERGKVIKLRR